MPAWRCLISVLTQGWLSLWRSLPSSLGSGSFSWTAWVKDGPCPLARRRAGGKGEIGGKWLAHGCCHFLEDMNSPRDVNTKRACKYVLRRRVTHPVYMEHMELMLYAHRVDGLTSLPHTNSRRLPLPERSSRVRQEAPGSGTLSQCQIVQTRRLKHSHIISCNHPHRDYAFNTRQMSD